MSKEEAKEIKKLWKKTKKAVEKVTKSAAAVIKIFVRQLGKKNLEDMRQATCEQNLMDGVNHTYGGGTKPSGTYSRTRLTALKNYMKLHMDNLRPGDHLPIPDEIKSKVMRDWFKNHRTGGRYLLLVDIWNHEKKLDPVHRELYLKLAPAINFTMCWAIPISVFEKSYRKMQFEEIRAEAEESYNDAQTRAKTQYESRTRV